MIKTKLYKTILDEGLLLDHYVVLCGLRDGKNLVKSTRIQGFINLLHKKGYIDDGILTEKAIALLDGEVTLITYDEPLEELPKPSGFNYGKWVIQLHKECEQTLIHLTGKRQVRDKIDSKAYSFLPNSTDLGKVIHKVINQYKLTDYEKIKRCILAYITRCAKDKNWFPILGYYIMKNNMSTLVTDMESLEDSTDTRIDDSIINI